MVRRFSTRALMMGFLLAAVAPAFAQGGRAELAGTVLEKQGVDDTPAKPILSALDSRGYAIRNGLDGQRKALLDGRVQYIWRIQRYQAGLFLEVYNLTNRANFGDRTGDRSSTNFMKTIVTDNPRTAQLGFRFVF